MPESQNSLDQRAISAPSDLNLSSTVAAARNGALQLIAVLIYLGMLPFTINPS
jgi:hypothetical protein